MQQLPPARQQGAASLLTMTMIILLLLVGTLFTLTTQASLRDTSQYGCGNAAQLAAESGIHYALAHAKNQPRDVDWDTWMNQLQGLTRALSDVEQEENLGTFSLQCTKNAQAPTNVHDYKITALGKVGNQQRTVIAYISMQEKTVPSVFDLIQKGSYSGKPWKISEDRELAWAPDNGYNQVLFNDYYYANDPKHLDGKNQKGFTLNYRVNLKNIIAGHESDSGYGIYYLANGTANNMTGYVLQYDPGLAPDQLLVKKVLKDTTSPNAKNPWLRESKPFKDDFRWFKNWDGSYVGDWGRNYWKYYGPANFSNEYGWESFQPQTGSRDDTIALPMESVMKKISGTMYNQAHTITIDVRPQSEGGVRHRILIDSVEMLNFVDRGLYSPPLLEGSTGLRVWSANVDFYNTTNSADISQNVVPPYIRAWGEMNATFIGN